MPVTYLADWLVQMGVLLRRTIFLKNLNDSPKWRIKGCPYVLDFGRNFMAIAAFFA